MGPQVPHRMTLIHHYTAAMSATPPPPFFSPAAERNKQPLLEALQTLLPPSGHALEIASGTGQHLEHFSAGLPGWTWQPSEFEAERLGWLRQLRQSWPAEQQRQRVAEALALDVSVLPWPVAPESFDLVFCANMLHVAPWVCCSGLMQGAAQALKPQGSLLTYGPYLEDDVVTAPSNLAFDAELRQRNPSWGLRRLADVQAEAARAGLQLAQRLAMPANNLLLVWRHSA